MTSDEDLEDGYPTLEAFLAWPDGPHGLGKRAWIRYKDLASYTRTGPKLIEGRLRRVVTRANTQSGRADREDNMERDPARAAGRTGQYRELAELTECLAREHGYEGVMVENVHNAFLPDVLEGMGYTRAGDDFCPCFYKLFETENT